MLNSVFLLAGVFGISLFSWQIGSSPILVSDVFLLIWIGMGLVIYRKVEVSILSVLGVLFWFVAVLGIYPLTQFNTSNTFESSSFVFSAVRLLMSVALLFVIAPIIRRIGYTRLGIALAWTIRLHVFVVIAMGTSNWLFATKLYRFANLGNYDPNTFLAWNRVSGFFAEPSYLGWFVALCVFMLAALTRIERLRFIQWYDYLLILTAMLLSTSLTGVLVVAAALSAVLISGFRASKGFRWITVLGVGAVAAILGGSGLAVLSTTQQADYIFKRLQDIQGGGDGSFRDRIPGSLEAGWQIFLESPFTGSGLGNLSQNVAHLMPRFQYKYHLNTDIHIAWVNVFATVGFVGGLVYLLMIGVLISQPSARLFGLGFLLVLFTWGGFALGVLWWFMAVALSLDSRPKNPRAKAMQFRRYT